MGMADRIKERRIAMDFTQEELAHKLGLQKSAIAKYEKGRVENIKRSIIEKMSELLDCSPAYLMGFDVPMETFEQKWNKEVKDFFDKTTAFEAELQVLGWTYELVGCQDWVYIDDGSMGLNDNGELVPGGKGRPIGCDTVEYGKVTCENCPDRYAHYLFTNGEITFKVSMDDYDTFLNDSQSFFKERLQQLLKKSMKQMFIDNSYELKAAHNDNATDPEQQRLMAEDVKDMEDNW